MAPRPGKHIRPVIDKTNRLPAGKPLPCFGEDARAGLPAPGVSHRAVPELARHKEGDAGGLALALRLAFLPRHGYAPVVTAMRTRRRIIMRISRRAAAIAAAVLTGLAALGAAGAASASSSAPRGHGDAGQLFYTTSGAGNGLPNGAEIFAITVSGSKVTTRDVGPTYGGDCGSLALSPHGTLYSMCGSLFGDQQLATIDQQTGRAHLFGVPVPGLAVMTMAFGPDGTLYAAGDCNPDPATFECTPGPADYNSLYKVDVRTGAFTRIGSTRAPQLFMDLTFDRHGTMLGVTTTVNPSGTPAVLYRIDPATGAATKLVNLVGSNLVMGLAFGRDGKLYATDNFPNSGLYVIDAKTGFETAIAALPFGFSSDLELMN